MTATGPSLDKAADDAANKAGDEAAIKAVNAAEDKTVDTSVDEAVGETTAAARDARHGPQASTPAPLLEVRGLTAGYGGGAVLHGVDVTVRRGELHAVVGPNGAGKTTFLHAVAGLVSPSGGRVRVGGHDVTGKSAHVVARSGAGIVPQGRRIFPSLTVDQHLRLAERAGRKRDGGWFRRSAPVARRGAGDTDAAGAGAGAGAGTGSGSGDANGSGDASAVPVWTRDRVLELLPRLGERLTHYGGELSGGEQQMLAVARALLGRPALLLLDEPTEGLAPAIADEIHTLLRELAAQGLGVLVATPQAALVDGIADHVVHLVSGRLVTETDGPRLVALSGVGATGGVTGGVTRDEAADDEAS